MPFPLLTCSARSLLQHKFSCCLFWISLPSLCTVRLRSDDWVGDSQISHFFTLKKQEKTTFGVITTMLCIPASTAKPTQDFKPSNGLFQSLQCLREFLWTNTKCRFCTCYGIIGKRASPGHGNLPSANCPITLQLYFSLNLRAEVSTSTTN